MKRYLIFLLVFVLAIGAVGASSSFDSALSELESFADMELEYFTNDTNVSVGDYNFTVPKDFGLIQPLSVDVSTKNESESVRFFTNSNREILMISITSSDSINETIHKYISDDIPYENTTIKGHDGLKWSNETYAFFTYRINNDLVVLQAPQDSYFEKMII